MKNGSLMLGAFLAVSGLIGCGSGGEAYCDSACECTGCSESQRQKCSDDLEHAELEAEQHDCLAEYNALVDCGNDNFECANDVVVPPAECTGEAVEYLECAGTSTDG